MGFYSRAAFFLWILDAGCWILDAGYWMLDIGYWCWMLDAG